VSGGGGEPTEELGSCIKSVILEVVGGVVPEGMPFSEAKVLLVFFKYCSNTSCPACADLTDSSIEASEGDK
jgi:hypothetical protein